MVSLVGERDEDQWVQVFGEGGFASPKTVVALAQRVVTQPTIVPLQVSLAPRGWEVVAYEDDRIITLADPNGLPATEATARTLNVHLPQPPTAPADLPTATGATGGEMYEVTVHRES
ncbi:MAG: hypothetical protein JWP52_4693 [Rhizobacter sp.]|nr:hypothetical protein [Rhizobacter sp.]